MKKEKPSAALTGGMSHYRPRDKKSLRCQGLQQMGGNRSNCICLPCHKHCGHRKQKQQLPWPLLQLQQVLLILIEMKIFSGGIFFYLKSKTRRVLDPQVRLFCTQPFFLRIKKKVSTICVNFKERWFFFRSTSKLI